jgi:hypothetical protein
MNCGPRRNWFKLSSYYCQNLFCLTAAQLAVGQSIPICWESNFTGKSEKTVARGLRFESVGVTPQKFGGGSGRWKSTPYIETGGGGFRPVGNLALFCGPDRASMVEPRKPRKWRCDT